MHVSQASRIMHCSVHKCTALKLFGPCSKSFQRFAVRSSKAMEELNAKSEFNILAFCQPVRAA